MKKQRKIINLNKARHLVLMLPPIFIGSYRLSPKRNLITLDQIARTFTVEEKDLVDLLIENLGDKAVLLEATLDDDEISCLPLCHLPVLIQVLDRIGNPLAARMSLLALAGTVVDAVADALDRPTDSDNVG